MTTSAEQMQQVAQQLRTHLKAGQMPGDVLEPIADLLDGAAAVEQYFRAVMLALMAGTRASTEARRDQADAIGPHLAAHALKLLGYDQLTGDQALDTLLELLKQVALQMAPDGATAH
jgi:hypothetical protein